MGESSPRKSRARRRTSIIILLSNNIQINRSCWLHHNAHKVFEKMPQPQ
ncbi:uncharacterized protein G2W53_045039 [Senna tora]|uniref:Uncharacterized protein n=1 Tax=Senna tora TaxID=362788 RepID=A0A834SMW6_9FABA|nr:uncharacterized protein G2W53_045039 [Senna tora]